MQKSKCWHFVKASRDLGLTLHFHRKSLRIALHTHTFSDWCAPRRILIILLDLSLHFHFYSYCATLSLSHFAIANWSWLGEKSVCTKRRTAAALNSLMHIDDTLVSANGRTEKGVCVCVYARRTRKHLFALNNLKYQQQHERALGLCTSVCVRRVFTKANRTLCVCVSVCLCCWLASHAIN